MEWMPMHGLIHDDGWFCFSVFALLPTLLFRFSSLFFSATLAYLMRTYHTLCIFSKPPTHNKNNNAEEKSSKKQSTTEQIFAQEKGKGWK